MAENNTHRVFFALWPDDETRDVLQKCVTPLLKKHPAKKVPVHNWHITLAFLGNVNADVYQCIQQQADKVTGNSFELQLDTFSYWKRPRVAWLGCEHTPEPLTELFDSLNRALEPCGYQPEFRQFAPHMTLLRKANQGVKAADFDPVQWSVREFVLVESQLKNNGSCYKVIRHWRL